MTIRFVMWTLTLSIAAFWASPAALADPITFVHTGALGSGTIGGTPFTDRPFTFTAVGDTLNREQMGNIFSTDHSLVTIDISGVGVFTILSATRTFFDSSANFPGFGRANGLDLYNGPGNAGLAGWDMLSSIGPVSGTTGLLQWDGGHPPVFTSGGQLIFNGALTTGTFEAVVVPEPTSIVLLGTAGALAAWRRLAGRHRGRNLAVEPQR